MGPPSVSPAERGTEGVRAVTAFPAACDPVPERAAGPQKRLRERRVERRFRFLERRTGFDRRAPNSIPGSCLLTFRESSIAFALLLGFLNLLNAADYACTLVALETGVAEANPFMATLFQQNPLSAGVAKGGLVLLASLLLWSFRSYRVVIQASLLLVTGLLAVFAYHVVGLALCC